MDYKLLISKFKSANTGISGSDEYLNCSVVALVLTDGTPQFLFEKRAEGTRQGGEISFPGGVIDTSIDKSPYDAALREVEEETGISPEMFSELLPLDTIISPMGALVHPFAGFVQGVQEKDIVIDELEISEVFTIPLSFFINNEPQIYHVKLTVNPSSADDDGRIIELLPSKKLNLPPMYHKPWGNMLHRIYYYKTDFGPIWGLTARIIFDFMKRIK
ncbi:MAG: CoA pyrophosphatase [Spirochaetes bacterium]|nr:CoA pyrophosphatase [Spirochaetota bacterium]MBP9023740.1 CoA pyrophosphatase [Spirochaetota bacterium]